MMRHTATYVIAASICVLFIMACPVSGASVEKASLSQLIEENQNINMNVEEMAFLLATHGYDASPKGDSVMVRLDGEVLSILP